MNNQTWKDDLKVLYTPELKPYYIDRLVVYISELLQREREEIKKIMLLQCDGHTVEAFNTGYKAGREEILKWAEDKVGENHDKLLLELLEELHTLINKDEKNT